MRISGKKILIFLNLVVVLLACAWLCTSMSLERAIVFFGSLSTLVAQILRIRDQELPVLSVRWLNSEDQVEEILYVKPIEGKSKEEILSHLDALRPSAEQLELVEKNKRAIAAYLTPFESRGSEFTAQAEVVKAVTDFAKKIDEMKELATSRFDEFSWQYNLRQRSVRPMLQIDNEGTAPATGVVIDLLKNDKVFFCEENQISELNIPVPEMSKRVERILELAKNPPTERDIADKQETLRLQRVLSPLASVIPSHSFSDRLMVTNREIFESLHWRVSFAVHDGSLRVVIKNNIKHKFDTDAKAKDVFLCPKLAEGEAVEIEYKCYADNLPSPQSGILKAVCGEADMAK